MKNTRKIFGKAPDGWEVFVPIKVMTIGFAYDSYKKPQLDQLWKDAYKKLKLQIPTLNPEEEYFWSEASNFLKDGSILFECRFFTPKSNRKKLSGPTYNNRKPFSCARY